MKYIYIVGSYASVYSDTKMIGTPYPILGVHTSQKKALDHFKIVVDDRRSRSTCIVHHVLNGGDKYMLDKCGRGEIAKALVGHKANKDIFSENYSENIFCMKVKLNKDNK